MDFRFTEDQLSIQSVARDFAQKRIAPIAADFDKSGEFPLETIREMGSLGLMGIEVPHEYGGAGLDPIGYVLAMIEIAAAVARFLVGTRVPALGRSRPAIRFSSVDLPLPDGPITATASPGAISRLTPSTALTGRT